MVRAEWTDRPTLATKELGMMHVDDWMFTTSAQEFALLSISCLVYHTLVKGNLVCVWCICILVKKQRKFLLKRQKLRQNLLLLWKLKHLVCYTILGEYEVFDNFAITFLNISHYNIILFYDHLNNAFFISIYKSDYKIFWHWISHESQCNRWYLYLYHMYLANP